MEHCIIRYDSLEDPLGIPSAKPFKLANRLGSLHGKTLLLLDNGKLTLGKTAIFNDMLHQRLQEEGVERILNERLAPSPEEYSDLSLLVSKTIEQVRNGPRFDAAILALGDSGSFSVRIVMLALELERFGFPTASIYTEPLVPTAAMIAVASCPDLPLVTVMHPTWSASETEVRETSAKAIPDIIRALTESSESVDVLLAAKRFVAGREAPTSLPERTVEATSDGAGRVILEVEPAQEIYEIYERFCENHLCDGFPIIPPTARRVQAMLQYTDRDAEEVLVEAVVPGMAPVTVRKLAVNAVMAGCKPEYFPIVVTAFEAMAEPRYNLGQGNTTFAMVGPAVIVSGPIAEEIGMNAGKGLLSPGCRANSTIGRAIFLALNNICGSIPGHTDNSGIGSQAKYSYCFAEQREKNPWQPLNEEFFDVRTTSVTVLLMYSPHSVMDHASETAQDLMTTFADVAKAIDRPVNQPIASYPTSRVVIFSPDHVRILIRDGWTKDDIRNYLFEHARIKLRKDKHPSIWAKSGLPRGWPKWMYHTCDDRVPTIRSPEDILIVVAGELGPHSAVCFPWGPSRPVTKAVTLKDGSPADSVRQFLET